MGKRRRKTQSKTIRRIYVPRIMILGGLYSMNPLNKSRSLLNKKLTFFLLAASLLWLKTYAAYQVEFSLGIQNDLQQFLLLINPISSGLFFLGISFIFKGRKQQIVLILNDFILTFILYANIVFYRFFSDFITLPLILQTKNFGEMGGSTLALMKPYDILYFVDLLILIGLVLFRFVKPKKRMSKRAIISVFATSIIFFALNLGLAEADRPQLLTRAFDRNYIVKYLGAYNYTVYDIIQSTRSSAQRALANSSDIADVVNYTKANYAEPSEKYFGKAKGRNVIFVSIESFQNFLINYEVNGQEVTPFLNSLTRDKNTFYFNNFFHQTAQGKTSDAEFMMENSLFPLPQGAAFYLKAENTYQATPAILKSRGYTSSVFHGNKKSFWNRDIMYKSLGYDKFFDARYYDMSDENVINYGLKDKPFFKESMPLLESLQQPFYAKFITLSNHFPFVLDLGDTSFPKGNFGDDEVVNRYFQTANYADQALKEFFGYLKSSGLYDNSIIVLYGDHYGISENHNEAMANVIGQEITPYINVQLQRVPLYIHVPGVESSGKPVDTYGGEVDVRPTIFHLLGIDTKDYIQIGSDLLSPEHREIVPFRSGDFVTPEYTSIKGECYENPSGKIVSQTLCEQVDKETKEILSLSDKILYGDLLRFYQPEDFVQFDKSKLDYRREAQDQDLPSEVLPNYDQESDSVMTSEG